MSADTLIRQARSLRLQAGRSAPLAARQLTALAERYEAEANLAIATLLLPLATLERAAPDLPA